MSLLSDASFSSAIITENLVSPRMNTFGTKKILSIDKIDLCFVYLFSYSFFFNVVINCVIVDFLN